MTIRLRQGVRALMIDDADHVLLTRFEFPRATVWALPGGGLEADEHPIAGLRRELHEELGVDRVEVGPHVWSRLHVIPMTTGHDGQRDEIFLVRTERFEPDPAIGWAAMNAEHVHEFRWWSVDEIEVATDDGTLFAPRRLGRLARDLVEHGAPDEPIDTGV